MKVLVVGAAGYLGRHVWRELEERGHEVVAVDACLWGQTPPTGLIKSNVNGGVFEDLWEQHKPDSVVWLGAIAHDPGGKIEECTHKMYTYRKPLECLSRYRGRAVFVSSLSVFNEPPLGPRTQAAKHSEIYPRLKREAERDIFHTTSTRCSILRFGTLFGPGVDTDSYREHLLLNKMVYDGLKHGVVRVANPKARRPVYPVQRAAEDVVEAAVSDYPPGVENRFTYSRSISEYGAWVAAYLGAELVKEQGVDTRDYGWEDGRAALDLGFTVDISRLADWTREHLEEIRPRRQIFERTDG